MKTVTEVRTALISTLKTLKIANGYLNDLPDVKIYPRWIQTVADDQNDLAYPKCFVVTETGENSRLIGEQEQRGLNFNVIVIVKKVAPSDDAQTMIESFLTDMEKLIFRQSTLLGEIQDVEITHFAIDGGILEPEGALVMRLATQRYSV